MTLQIIFKLLEAKYCGIYISGLLSKILEKPYVLKAQCNSKIISGLETRCGSPCAPRNAPRAITSLTSAWLGCFSEPWRPCPGKRRAAPAAGSLPTTRERAAGEHGPQPPGCPRAAGSEQGGQAAAGARLQASTLQQDTLQQEAGAASRQLSPASALSLALISSSLREGVSAARRGWVLKAAAIPMATIK